MQNGNAFIMFFVNAYDKLSVDYQMRRPRLLPIPTSSELSGKKQMLQIHA